MRESRIIVVLTLALAAATAGSAAASGFGLFQHGGRAMGQVGAFTARASEPSATTYNPAAITRLSGFQFQAGLDFNNAEDEYSSRTGSFAAKHVIQFPPALYATYKPEDLPIAFGIGVDSPFYYAVDWEPRLFPGRFLNRRFEMRVFEVHPVLAYDLGDGWSVGGGVRYVFGSLEQEDNAIIPVFATTQTVPVEIERNVSADVDDIAWDVALHYADNAWGWGAVYRSPVRLKGNGDVKYNPRDVPQGVPGLQSALDGRFQQSGASESFELPREVRGGLWVAPYPELRLELDLAYQTWSSLENTDVTINNDAFGDGPTVRTPRDWEDTLSIRFGLEGDITDRFALNGGVAFEPSPVPDRTVEPGFPRGDAWVYAAGFSYSFPDISFDVGYSRHQHDNRGGPRQEPLNPTVNGSYSATDQVWGFAVRWRK
ncbi:MAG TPA: outer membrane protein transport protein [Thermoanaerobaculia bacterium]|jgi:long-chain fatty acid transport protein|nr:outer membrane protein transport protein [Thermoanaerobaculia bacterium]